MPIIHEEQIPLMVPFAVYSCADSLLASINPMMNYQTNTVGSFDLGIVSPSLVTFTQECCRGTKMVTANRRQTSVLFTTVTFFEPPQFEKKIMKVC